MPTWHTHSTISGDVTAVGISHRDSSTKSAFTATERDPDVKFAARDEVTDGMIVVFLSCDRHSDRSLDVNDYYENLMREQELSGSQPSELNVNASVLVRLKKRRPRPSRKISRHLL